MPSSRFTRKSACRKFFSATGSSWEVGSSSSSRRGCIASVPASVTICFWPPDSPSMERRNHGSMPKKCATSATRRRIASCGTPRFSRPKASVPHGIAHDLVLGALRHVTCGGGRLAHVETVHGAAEQGERSRALACRRDGRRAAPQKRGLAAAGGPHDQLERALLNAPVERPDARRRPRVSEREAARLHGGHARGRRRRCGRGRRHICLRAARRALRRASRRVLGRAVLRAFWPQCHRSTFLPHARHRRRSLAAIDSGKNAYSA